MSERKLSSNDELMLWTLINLWLTAADGEPRNAAANAVNRFVAFLLANSAASSSNEPLCTFCGSGYWECRNHHGPHPAQEECFPAWYRVLREKLNSCSAELDHLKHAAATADPVTPPQPSGNAGEFSALRAQLDDMTHERDRLRVELKAANESIGAAVEVAHQHQAEQEVLRVELKATTDHRDVLQAQLNTANRRLGDAVEELEAASQELTRLRKLAPLPLTEERRKELAKLAEEAYLGPDLNEPGEQRWGRSSWPRVVDALVPRIARAGARELTDEEIRALANEHLRLISVRLEYSSGTRTSITWDGSVPFARAILAAATGGEQ